MEPQPPDVADRILESARTIAVVGLSPDPRRLNRNARPLNGNACRFNMYAYGLITHEEA